MARTNVVVLSIMVLISTLAIYVGDSGEFSISEEDHVLEDSQQSHDEMNQTLAQQNITIAQLELLNSNLQQLLDQQNLTLQEKDALITACNDSRNQLIMQIESLTACSESRNQLIMQIESLNANVSNLQAEISDAEAYRDLLLSMLENANSTSEELESSLKEELVTIYLLGKSLEENQTLVSQWQQLADDNRARWMLGSAHSPKLDGVNLGSIDLSGAWLWGDFEGVILHDANLSGADMHMNLRDASLQWANLSGASLNGGSLRGANLSYANLSGANLSWVFGMGADFTGADLTGAKMYRSNMFNLLGCPAQLPDDWYCLDDFLIGPYANLGPSADNVGANLSGANLTGARLNGSNLPGADLSGANLRYVYLSGANLGYSNLSGADLTGADLTGAELTGADLSGVQWLSTICPDGTNSSYNKPQSCENHLY